MKKYTLKETQPLTYKNAEGITTNYGLVFMRREAHDGDTITYRIWRRPHQDIGHITYNYSTHLWSAHREQKTHNGQPFWIVHEVDLLSRTQAIIALQRKDPLNWGKDANGEIVAAYKGR